MKGMLGGVRAGVMTATTVTFGVSTAAGAGDRLVAAAGTAVGWVERERQV